MAVVTLTYRSLRDGGRNLKPWPPPVFLRLMTRRVTLMTQKQRTRNMLFRNTWVLTMIRTMRTWMISNVRHQAISYYPLAIFKPSVSLLCLKGTIFRILAYNKYYSNSRGSSSVHGQEKLYSRRHAVVVLRQLLAGTEI